MNRIKEIRRAKGVTQSALAIRAKVSQPYINDLENNRRGAKPETMRRIAEALEVSTDELMGESA